MTEAPMFQMSITRPDGTTCEVSTALSSANTEANFQESVVAPAAQALSSAYFGARKDLDWREVADKFEDPDFANNPALWSFTD